MATPLTKFQRMQRFLPGFYLVGANPNITDWVTAISQSDQDIINNLQFIHDQLFIVSAISPYLEYLGANYGVYPPTTILVADPGLREFFLDMAFTPKQVRTVMYQVLSLFFGFTSCHSTVSSVNEGPYDFSTSLPSELSITIDGTKQFLVTFQASNFVNIAAVTALEVATQINNVIAGSGIANVALDNAGNEIVQISTLTPGLAGSIQVNALIAGQILTINQIPAPTGAGYQVGDILTVSTGNDDALVRVISIGGGGTVTGVALVDGGSEYDIGTGQTTTGGHGAGATITVLSVATPANVVLAFPTTLVKSVTVAVVEINPKQIILTLPEQLTVITGLMGASYFYPDNTIPSSGWPGNFLYDNNLPNNLVPYSVSFTTCNTTEELDVSNVYANVTTTNCEDFPNAPGQILFTYSSSPTNYYLSSGMYEVVPYTGVAGPFTLGLDPAYTFQHTWPAGTTVTYLGPPMNPIVTALDYSYPIYFTSTEVSEALATELFDLIRAAGVKLAFEIKEVNYIYDGNFG